jgi:hypothetical protein
LSVVESAQIDGGIGQLPGVYAVSPAWPDVPSFDGVQLMGGGEPPVVVVEGKHAPFEHVSKHVNGFVAYAHCPASQLAVK